MAKRIVFCADGTWQRPRNNTNVYRLYKGLLQSQDQFTFYDDGVGADGSGLDRLIQGATGDGLLQKIKDAYTKISHVYEPGDRIFLLGFSFMNSAQLAAAAPANASSVRRTKIRKSL